METNEYANQPLPGSNFMFACTIAMKTGQSFCCCLRRRLALLLTPLVLVQVTTGVQAAEPVSLPSAHAVSHAHDTPARPVTMTPVLNLQATAQLEDIIPALAGKRVVLVAETHDRYDHHLTQLEIIRRLHALNPRLAIGMEAFQQPYQAVLDDYVEGRLDEQALLRGTGYYRLWKFDFRHYAPILAYAREHHLPVVALNLPVELIDRVSRVGIEGLTESERGQIPAAIDHSDTAYAERLRGIYAQHPDINGRGFDGFLEVQLAWDEGMAERAADYLTAHPGTNMVLLAGTGHIAYGSGIPQRLQRRLQDDITIILNDWGGPLEPGLADYLLMPQKQTLPPSGKLGALLDEQEDRLLIDHCLADSPCRQAGLRSGDRILSVNDEPVNDMADLRLAIWNLMPGERITLEVERRRWFRRAQVLNHEIVLY
jgi:uncharacterized iron-regulated protein